MGQRAHLAVRSGTLRIVATTPVLSMNSGQLNRQMPTQYSRITDDTPTYWEARYQFELANLGNSPRKTTKVRFVFGMKDRWTIQPSIVAVNNLTLDQDMKGATGRVGDDVGPKALIVMPFTIQLVMPYRDAKLYRSRVSDRPVAPFGVSARRVGSP